MSSPVGAVKKVNDALAQYYLDLNTPFLINGMGKFENFCEENGFLDDDIASEIAAGVHDCSLIEFDMDPNDGENNLFPFKQKVLSKSKKSVIYEIIKTCYETGSAPTGIQFDISTFDLNIDDDVRQQAVDKYQQELPCLGVYFKQPALMEWTALSYKNGIPFLQMMVDSFMKDNQICFGKDKTTLTVTTWCHHKKNEIMNYIRSQDSGKADGLENAMKDYTNRIVAGLQFSNCVQVNDDLEEIVRYIIAIPNFIRKMMVIPNVKGLVTPFQLDLLIAVRNIQSAVLSATTHDDNKDNNDDDNDDDDDDNDDDNVKIDYIGDVSDKLVSAKLPCFHQVASNQKLASGITRYFTIDFWNKGFKKAIQNDDNKDNNDWDKYPANRRFCVFVDRRPPDNDEIIFFQAPSDCGVIPTNCVPEWYFESLRQCIIPRKGYTGNMDKEMKYDADALDKDKTITSQSHADGQLMTFSFHVFQRDLIKCYINWCGQTTRFHGEYFKTVLPLLFVDDINNNKFTNDDKTLIFAVQDDMFDQFHQKSTIHK